jgi:hypothetical protein
MGISRDLTTREVAGPPDDGAASVDQAFLDRRALLDEFGLITEEDFALLIGCEVKTVRNTAWQDLPEHIKVGRQRLFKKAAVEAYLDRRIVTRRIA